MSNFGMDAIQLIKGFEIPIWMRQPKIKEESLESCPSLFYFTSTGEESLGLDPFNQPVKYALENGFKVFSMTLPGHGSEHDNNHALGYFAKKIAQGENIVENFVKTCIKAIDFLVQMGLVDENKIAVCGLSRGAFIATHLAAKDQRIKTILGFSPLARLDGVHEFKEMNANQMVQQLALISITKELTSKTLRFYIGNHDTRVGTDICFNFIHKLTEDVIQEGVRQAPIELIIFPSIGHKGHGTPPNIFKDGIDWLKGLI